MINTCPHHLCVYTFFKVNSTPNMGLKLTTPRSRVACSTGLSQPGAPTSFVYDAGSICVTHNTLQTFIFTWHHYFPILSLTCETLLILHFDHEL